MKKFLNDPHFFLFKIGASIVLAIELGKFIKYVIEH
jgi:hypothetical protein